jgi:hypothetical protein
MPYFPPVVLRSGALPAATAQAQEFTNGIKSPSIQAITDATTHGWKNAAGTNVLTVDTTNGAVGILGDASPNAALALTKVNINATAGETWTGQRITYSDISTASNSHTIQGINLAITSLIAAGLTNSGTMRGANITAFQNGSGSVANLTGLFGQVGSTTSTGTITNARALQFSLIKAAGTTIGSAYGIDLDWNIATTSILYGINLQASIADTTYKYGIFIGSVSGGTTDNYAIYTNAGLVRFGGQVRMTASTTSAASLNVPHGAPPTSPVNGDEWTTTAGSFVQINGVTKTHVLVSSPATYTPSNVTPDRAYDANATTLEELADIVGTLIADLKLTGIIL